MFGQGAGVGHHVGAFEQHGPAWGVGVGEGAPRGRARALERRLHREALGARSALECFEVRACGLGDERGVPLRFARCLIFTPRFSEVAKLESFELKPF